MKFGVLVFLIVGSSKVKGEIIFMEGNQSFLLHSAQFMG